MNNVNDSPAGIVLRNGTIFDGSGAPRFNADLWMKDGLIVAIDKNITTHVDTRQIDVSGLAVAPGFIDVHSHDDAYVLNNPQAPAKLSQGVTTVIVGNCGISLSPYKRQQDIDLPPPFDLLGEMEEYQFATLADYARAVNTVRPALNVAALVGHSTLRAGCMMELSRRASARKAQRMSEMLQAAFADGALGLSSGVAYPPAAAADSEELIPLARIAAQHGGVYVTHVRDEADDSIAALQEAMSVAENAGAPLVISHHKCVGQKNWGGSRNTLKLIENYKSKFKINTDVYPYLAGSTVLQKRFVDNTIDVLITWSKPFPHVAGRLLADIAAEWRCTQHEACDLLQPGGACYFFMCEDDLRQIMAHPATMIGSDGLPNDTHPHPRLWGTFPRVLGHYCREVELFDLETAVHKMSGLSAGVFNLAQRGILKTGNIADITVFDPARIAELSSYEEPVQAGSGIEYVFVNGRTSYFQGKYTSSRQGRFLPNGQ